MFHAASNTVCCNLFKYGAGYHVALLEHILLSVDVKSDAN